MNKNTKTPQIDSQYYCSQLPTMYREPLDTQTALTQPLDTKQLTGNGETIDTIRSAQSSGLSNQLSMLDRHVYAINQRNKAAESAHKINTMSSNLNS